MRRALAILLAFSRDTGHEHPHLRLVFGNYSLLLAAQGQTEAEIKSRLTTLIGPAE